MGRITLPFAELSYNNSYQASLQMAPFEVLYGRKCRTPLNWSETEERTLIGPDIIQHAEVTQNMHGASINYRYVWDVLAPQIHLAGARPRRGNTVGSVSFD